MSHTTPRGADATSTLKTPAIIPVQIIKKVSFITAMYAKHFHLYSRKNVPTYS